MDFRKFLMEFKKRVDVEIEIFFDEKIAEISKEDPWVTEGMRYVKKLVLQGGKRIRPALVYWGYKACGGLEEERILKVCVGIELVHIFLLIHDDIIDQSDRRHGIETVNFWSERQGQKKFIEKDLRRFGNSMAIVLGDITYAWANRAFIEAGFTPEQTLKVLELLQKIVSMTCIGESQDVVIEYETKATEMEILQMYHNKTAKYTFEGPLHLGAILAGAGNEKLTDFSDYGIPVGVAFQIQDDILGIFGSEDKLGKSTASDIIEGKKTILTARVFSNGNIFQRERIDYLLGKRDITSEEISEFQEIIMDSGALKYAKEKARKYIKKAKIAIDKSDISMEAKEFLVNLAEYILKRDI